MPTRTAGDRTNQRLSDVEISVDGGTTWVDYSSYLTAVTPDSAEIESEESRTLDGTVEVDYDETLGTESITIRMLVTEALDGPYDVMYDRVRATDKRFDLRYGAGGYTTGDRQFTTSGGQAVSCPAAAFDSTTKGSVFIEGKLVCDSIGKGTKA